MTDLKQELIISDKEVLKNRVFGMPTSKMTRHQRVSFTAMVKIAYDDLKANNTKRVFEYNTKEFFELIGITQERKQSHLFAKTFVDEDGWEQESSDYALEKTLRELITKEIVFRFKDKSGQTYKVEATALLSYFKLTKEKIVFEFSEWIRDKILVTNNAYIMKLPLLASFKSGYTVTLFEQIEQRRDFNRWEVSYRVLRAIFGIEEEKYQRFNHFKERVLEVAVNEIVDKSNYSLKYELIRGGRGRAVQKVIFTWHINKTTLMEFKSFIRANFVNIPLIVLAGDDGDHLIQVSEDGKLYNAHNPKLYYPTKRANAIWRVMYDNQDKMLIKKQSEKVQELEDEDYSQYYGKNLLFDDEMYEHIILVHPTAKKNRLKVKFQAGEMIVMSKEEFLNSVII